MANKNGKIISVCSVKGGVGKTIITTNLAGVYSYLKLKTLIIDLDLYAGGIATVLNVKNTKDVFMLVDSLTNNRFSALSDYITKYNDNIDVLASPKDPRQATKIDSKYISIILELAKKEYDVVLIDTNHVLDATNLIVLDASYMSLFIITNDIVDLKNMKSLISIFKDLEKTNYITILNNSRDTGKDYLTNFDIKNVIKTNIDYVIPHNFYIKNIDKYVLNGEILVLNKTIDRFHHDGVYRIRQIAENLIDSKHKGGKKDE